MNHIYKVIWSRVKHCYVVVSEIATNGGKSRTVFEKKNASFGALLCAFALAGCLMPGVAEASFNAGTGSSVFHKNSIAVGGILLRLHKNIRWPSVVEHRQLIYMLSLSVTKQTLQVKGRRL